MAGVIQWATTVANAVKTAIDQHGMSATVTLRGGSPTFNAKVAEGRGRVRSITDGLDQQRYRVTVMASVWDAGAGGGRPPQKGDLVVVQGRRHMVDRVTRATAGDTVLAYVMFMEG